MSQSPLSFLLLFIFTTSLPISSTFAGDHDLDFVSTQPSCRGTVGECLSGEEFAVDLETNRRILATSQYIGYQALKRNSVPCSRRGASYSNCRPGAPANPYRRPCSDIKGCRG